MNIARKGFLLAVFATASAFSAAQYSNPGSPLHPMNQSMYRQNFVISPIMGYHRDNPLHPEKIAKEQAILQQQKMFLTYVFSASGNIQSSGYSDPVVPVNVNKHSDSAAVTQKHENKSETSSFMWGVGAAGTALFGLGLFGLWQDRRTRRNPGF